MSAENLFLASAIKRFLYYKDLGDRAIRQLQGDDLNFIPATESNSISVIIRHMHGNMISRWTDFLITDGEKKSRERDAEFEEGNYDPVYLLSKWEDGWRCLINALDELTDKDLDKIVHIRKEAMTVVDAINRQLSHYPYHVGQIVYIARMIKGKDWESLSIPRKNK